MIPVANAGPGRIRVRPGVGIAHMARDGEGVVKAWSLDVGVQAELSAPVWKRLGAIVMAGGFLNVPLRGAPDCVDCATWNYEEGFAAGMFSIGLVYLMP
jgi:hypothetical protein